MLLSIITVAFRNLEGIVKTHASLAHLAQVEDITLGNNVTVGAGSVVLDSVPDNALVVGEKARVKVIK